MIAGEIFANINAKHVVQVQLGQKTVIVTYKVRCWHARLDDHFDFSLAMHVWIIDATNLKYTNSESSFLVTLFIRVRANQHAALRRRRTVRGAITFY